MGTDIESGYQGANLEKVAVADLRLLVPEQPAVETRTVLGL